MDGLRVHVTYDAYGEKHYDACVDSQPCGTCQRCSPVDMDCVTCGCKVCACVDWSVR